MAGEDNDDTYCREVLQSLHTFQQTGYLCDTVLIADDGQLKAHGALLAAASSLFKQGLPAAEKPMEHIIVLPGFRCHVVDIALCVIYSGTLRIPDKHLAEDGLAQITAKLLKLGLQVPPVKHHAFRMLHTMYEFHRDSYLCDTLILADDVKFRAHSPVLAAASELFKQGLPAHDEPAEHVFTLPGFSYSALEAVLHIIYCGNLPNIQRDRLAELIPTLQQLGLKVPVIADSSVDKVKRNNVNRVPPAESNRLDLLGNIMAADVNAMPKSTNELEMVVVKVEQTDEFDEKPFQQTELSENKAGSEKEHYETGSKELVSSDPEIRSGELQFSFDSDTEFKCDACDSKFPTLALLQEHHEVHVFPLISECIICNARIRRSNMKRHMRCQHMEESDGRYVCNVCGAKLSSHFGLKRHLKRHEGEGSYACQDCGASFTSLKFLKGHIQATHAKTFSCAACGKAFEQQSTLKMHQRTAHSTAAQPCSKRSMNQQPRQQVLPDEGETIRVKAEDAENVGESGRRRVACDVCGLKFWSIGHLNRHREVHKKPVQSTVFECNVCNAKLSTKHNLNVHVKSVHNNLRSYVCPECGTGFNRMAYLKNHVSKAHPGCTVENVVKKSIERPRFECDVCGLKVSTAFHLGQHRVIHADSNESDPTFTCATCNAKFHRKQQLTQHQNTAHGPVIQPLELPYVCPACCRQFATKQGLCQHMHTHDELRTEIEKQQMVKDRFACVECKKYFSCKLALKIHRQYVHTDARPYSCSLCPATFKMKHCLELHVGRIHCDERNSLCTICGHRFKFAVDLDKHLRSHSDDRPYRCSMCTASYKTKRSLREHVDRVHEAGRQFECKVCGRVYSARGSLTEHMDTHSEERQYVCSTCGKKFALRRILLKHERIHTGEKPFACPTCGERFMRYNQRRRHMLEHSEVPPESEQHRCELCDKSFVSERGLQMHSLLVHDVELRNFCRDEEMHTSIPVDVALPAADTLPPLDDNKPSSTESNPPATDAGTFVCRTCGKKFAFPYMLARHQYIHHADAPRPYKCTVCGLAFKMQEYLMRHQQTKCSENGRKTYQCFTCSKLYTNYESLRKHRKQHHGANNGNRAATKTYSHFCRTCGKKFEFRHLLARHEQIHVVDAPRPYKCTMCALTFRRQDHLTRHKQSHGAQKYRCTVCYKEFKDRAWSRKHKCKVASGDVAESSFQSVDIIPAT